MGRFDRYLLSQLMTLFGFFSLVLVMVYWINRAVRLFDQLIADGQSAWVFLEFTALSLPSIMASVLPLSAFAASLFVANKLITESELVVVQATGFSPWRLARPVFAFGLIVTLLVQVLTHILVPLSTAQLELRQSEIAQDTTARLLQEGQFLSPAQGLTLYISQITPEGELRNFFLSDRRDPEVSITYTSAKAYLVKTEELGTQIVMLDGIIQRYTEATKQLGTLAFTDFAYDIGSVMPSTAPQNRTYRELSTLELLSPTEAIIAETGRSAGQLNLTAHDRFSAPFLGLIGAILGFTTLLLGSFSRFGVWKQIGLAVFFVILVKTVESLATSSAKAAPEMWILLYMPLVFGLVLSGILLFIAANPHSVRRFRRVH